MELHYHLSDGSVVTQTKTRPIPVHASLKDMSVTKTISEVYTQVLEGGGSLVDARPFTGAAYNAADILFETLNGQIFANELAVLHQTTTTLRDEDEARRLGAPDGMFSTVPLPQRTRSPEPSERTHMLPRQKMSLARTTASSRPPCFPSLSRRLSTSK